MATPRYTVVVRGDGHGGFWCGGRHWKDGAHDFEDGELKPDLIKKIQANVCRTRNGDSRIEIRDRLAPEKPREPERNSRKGGKESDADRADRLLNETRLHVEAVEQETERMRSDASRSRAAAELEKAEAERLQAEASRARAEAERAKAEAEAERAKAETAKAEAERAKAEADKARADANRAKAEAEKEALRTRTPAGGKTTPPNG